MSVEYRHRVRAVLILIAVAVVLSVSGFVVMLTLSRTAGVVLIFLSFVVAIVRYVRYGVVTPERSDADSPSAPDDH